MDSLDLDATGIEIIPLSVGQLCTSLVSFHIHNCNNLKRIEGNFRLLKSLKDLHLYGCWKLEKLAWDFFDDECYLEVLSLSIKNQGSTLFDLVNSIELQSFHQQSSMVRKFPQFPRLLRKLNLSDCHLRDGDIPFDISELLNLQVLDLSGNKFSRLHSSLSQIRCLKFLNLSACRNLVELPILPLSIAILKANCCDSLKSIGDLSNYKWLWKVSLRMSKKPIDSVRVLQFMLQVNALEDRFMSVELPGEGPLECSNNTKALITLQLPHNWCNDFSGFLLYVDSYLSKELCIIVIKHQMSSTNTQCDQWKKFDINMESYEHTQVGYVPFGSLRHIPWWNCAYTNNTFQIHAKGNPKAVLVPRKSKICDSRERPNVITNRSEFWDKEIEDSKTFEMTDYSNSSKIMILWSHV